MSMPFDAASVDLVLTLLTARARSPRRTAAQRAGWRLSARIVRPLPRPPGPRSWLILAAAVPPRC